MILFNLKFITSKNYCLLFSVSNKPAQCPVVTAHCAAVLTQHPQSLCSSLSEVLDFVSLLVRTHYQVSLCTV